MYALVQRPFDTRTENQQPLFWRQLAIPKVACNIMTKIHTITHIAFPTMGRPMLCEIALVLCQCPIYCHVCVRLPSIVFLAHHLCFLCIPTLKMNASESILFLAQIGIKNYHEKMIKVLQELALHTCLMSI